MYIRIKTFLVITCFGAAFFAFSCVSSQIEKEVSTEIKAQVVKTDSTTVKVKKKEETQNNEIKVSKTKVKKFLTENEQIDRLIEKMNKAQSDKVATKADIMIKTIFPKATPQVVKGTAIIKKAEKFNVHYTEPQEQLIVSNGINIWIYTPVMQQVIKQTVESANVDAKLYTDMGSSIAHFAKNSKTVLFEDELSYSLIMIPEKRKGIIYDEIKATIDKKSFVPIFMSLKYEGTVTEMTFTNIKNYTKQEAENVAELADNSFTFVKPDGTEEIEGADLMKGVEK